LREIATFISYVEHFEGQKQRFLLKTLLQCSQHYSHLGNDCPIRIVEGEVDTKYKDKVFGHWFYNYTAHPWTTVHRRYVRCTILCICMMCSMLYLYNLQCII
jgi:hypothetical protein